MIAFLTQLLCELSKEDDKFLEEWTEEGAQKIRSKYMERVQQLLPSSIMGNPSRGIKEEKL